MGYTAILKCPFYDTQTGLKALAQFPKHHMAIQALCIHIYSEKRSTNVQIIEKFMLKDKSTNNTT